MTIHVLKGQVSDEMIETAQLDALETPAIFPQNPTPL